MFRISVFVFETFIMLVTAFSFGVGWNVVRFRKPSRFKRVFVIVVRCIMFVWLTVLYGFSLFLFFRAEQLDPMVLFILFGGSAIAFILMLPGKLNDPVDQPIVRPLMSRKVTRIGKRVLAVWAICVIVWMASFFLVSFVNDARAKRLSYESISNEAFAIDDETVVFADEEHVYLLSNHANGVSIYRHDKTYVGTYYFTPSRNGKAEFFVWNDRLFVHSKDGTIFAYGDGTYLGRMEFTREVVNETATAWDHEGRLLYQLSLGFSFGVVVFDADYIYIERLDGSYKTDGIVSLPWDAEYETASGQTRWDDFEYILRDNRLFQNNEVFLTTNFLYFVGTHFAWGWCLILTMAFSLLAFRKVSKLQQIGNDVVGDENDPIQV